MVLIVTVAGTFLGFIKPTAERHWRLAALGKCAVLSMRLHQTHSRKALETDERESFTLVEREVASSNPQPKGIGDEMVSKLVSSKITLASSNPQPKGIGDAGRE